MRVVYPFKIHEGFRYPGGLDAHSYGAKTVQNTTESDLFRLAVACGWKIWPVVKRPKTMNNDLHIYYSESFPGNSAMVVKIQEERGNTVGKPLLGLSM